MRPLERVQGELLEEVKVVAVLSLRKAQEGSVAVSRCCFHTALCSPSQYQINRPPAFGVAAISFTTCKIDNSPAASNSRSLASVVQ